MTGSVAALRRQLHTIRPKGRFIVCITEEEVPPDVTDRDTVIILGERYRNI